MSFDFDAGAGESQREANFVDAWECNIRDRLGHDHTDQDYHREAAKELINEIWDRKKAETVRKRFWNRLYMMAAMSRETPEAHDQIILEFAERLSGLAESPAEPDDGTAPDEAETARTSADGKEDGYGF